MEGPQVDSLHPPEDLLKNDYYHQSFTINTFMLIVAVYNIIQNETTTMKEKENHIE